MRAFQVVASVLLVLTIAVIIWGAYVRVTGSGAGCGRHWPLCNGEVLPSSPSDKTAIEFTHRVTSGLAAVGALLLFLWSRRRFRPPHPARTAAGWTLGFMAVEVAIGALLVLLRLVENDSSLLRAIVIGGHLINSMLLLGAMTLAAMWGGAPVRRLSLRPGFAPIGAFACLGMVLLVGATGAIAALGDTLFPASSLAAGLLDDFNPAAHFLIRLRTVHPFIAVIASCFVLALAATVLFEERPLAARITARLLITAVLAQLVLGFINVLLLAPAELQLAHLFAACVVWILLVLVAADVCYEGAERLHRAPGGRGGIAAAKGGWVLAAGGYVVGSTT